MKDINSLYQEGRSIVAECVGEDKLLNIKEVKINTRAKTRWGLCKYKGSEDRVIEISSRVLADSVPHDAALTVMIHELLHACKDGRGHRGTWKKYAGQVMKKYPNLVITRTTSYEFFGLQAPKKKYTIKCDKCGYTHYSNRMSSTIKHPERYTHRGCGGHFKRVR